MRIPSRLSPPRPCLEPKTLTLSAIRIGVTDFGIVEKPCIIASSESFRVCRALDGCSLRQAVGTSLNARFQSLFLMALRIQTMQVASR